MSTIDDADPPTEEIAVPADAAPTTACSAATEHEQPQSAQPHRSWSSVGIRAGAASIIVAALAAAVLVPGSDA